jgi:predicted lipase
MNKKEAMLCARVAQATYGGSGKVSDFRLTARFENRGTDTQGIFGEAYGNTFVIAFRGSEETGLADWITDLKFIKQVFPYAESKNKKVKVHHGFISAYKSVREEVLKAAKETPHQRIICTGHSLGGALATLCALDVQYNLPDKKVSCYTYGSPKVGNADFAQSYNQRVPNTFRFVNSADTVPSMPPGGYEHVGMLHHVGQVSSKLGEIGDFVEKVIDKVEDHFPHNYIKALQELFD